VAGAGGGPPLPRPLQDPQVRTDGLPGINGSWWHLVFGWGGDTKAPVHPPLHGKQVAAWSRRHPRAHADDMVCPSAHVCCVVVSCGGPLWYAMVSLPWQRGVLLRLVGCCPVPLPQSPCPPSPRLSPTRDAVSLVGCTPCSRGTPLLPAPLLACGLSRCGPRRVLVHCWEGWMYCCLHSHLCASYRCSCCVVPGLSVASHVGTAFWVGKGGGSVGQYA
jgi:hypothetical protein